MKYTGNKQIVKEFRKVLIEVGKTQQEAAEMVGISRQSLNSMLKKQHISFDDMERYLAPLGYYIDFEFKKIGG